MPKVNVYLPDELADAVKAASLPVSAICQRALEQSVRRVSAIRAMTLDDVGDLQLAQFTERMRTVIRLGMERSAGAPAVGTEHLLHGMLSEGSNLALQVLRAMEIDPVVVERALAARLPSADGAPAKQFSGPAANALELTVTEAIALGHNYVGCEHLLLGLLSEPSGAAGEVLHEAGVELRTARKTVVAALTGYAHLRAQSGMDPIAAAIRKELKPVIERIERLEERTES
ncbi:Clp protease N-terminal domain-containing protein [Kibdelosporangium phytohabitans]|uniref:Peptidase n=1 Tax=Kibdelosporangium phytohabitans TaxID=860235 RepID=A0A0N9IAI3_9PSEU|nr:Clp protease N-terminal domain-containing protein [Kibdelosporangium phytohabitans]ALG11620.1 peptidase [Kibdelosporangium phytohabitans]MBE1462998.1 ATP-dependent Clp protease ATP-binding subunit ClpC [Kibdelosporangium phytohabitans]